MKVALLGQLLHGIAAVQQHAGIAIDIGDLLSQARRGAVAGIERKDALIARQAADIDDGRSNGAGANRSPAVT